MLLLNFIFGVSFVIAQPILNSESEKSENRSINVSQKIKGDSPKIDWNHFALNQLKTSLRGIDLEEWKQKMKTIQNRVEASSNFQKKTIKTNKNLPEKSVLEVNKEAGLIDYLYQGDIILTEHQLSSLKASHGNRRKRQIEKNANDWTNKIVFYLIDKSIDKNTEKSIIKAIDLIQSQTCVRFIQSSSAKNRIKIFNGAGCYSYLGMIGGEQALSLGNGCNNLGTVVHEFLHALGFIHTQMRYDRDDFVAIDLSDVSPPERHNFNKLTAAENQNLVDYEFGSVMHYSARAFVRAGKNSIVPKDSDMLFTIGSLIVSFQDIRALNIHYSCSCPSELPCQNSGYPNPSKCSQCICPYGFGGEFCEQRLGYQCGAADTIESASRWQTFNYWFGVKDFSSPLRADFDFCMIWITAPAGKKIQLRINNFFNPQCQYGCPFNGIEPKLNADWSVTQPRYCCEEVLNKILESETNVLPLFSYNRYYYSSVNIQFRYVDNNDENPNCADLSSQSVCQELASNRSSDFPLAELEKMCAKTLGLCGKKTKTPWHGSNTD